MSSPVGVDTVVGVRSAGVTRVRSLSPLDFEILAFLVRFTYGRSHHLVGWTGAAPKTVEKRLTFLASVGMIRKTVRSVDLTNGQGQIVSTVAHMWEVTHKGAAVVEDWVVPGTGGVTVSLPAPKPSHLMAHHVLGVADLAVWYRRSGLEVAAEREILSLERPSPGLTPDRKVYSFWTVQVPGQRGVHPPDLGAVDLHGNQWAVELERATKSVQEYTDVIGAYQAAGKGQIWHVLSNKTAERLAKAAARRGIQWGPPPARGVHASVDGMVRLQGWRPGRTGLSDPRTWRHQWPATAPAGLPLPAEAPDLSKSWRRGRIIDPETDY